MFSTLFGAFSHKILSRVSSFLIFIGFLAVFLLAILVFSFLGLHGTSVTTAILDLVLSKYIISEIIIMRTTFFWKEVMNRFRNPDSLQLTLHDRSYPYHLLKK